MRLMRIGQSGSERPVASIDGRTWFDVRPIAADITPSFLERASLDRLRETVVRGDLPRADVADERIGPPLAAVRSIVCVGMNYAAHAEESGAAPPEELVIFFKKPNTLCGPNDPIRAVDARSTLDWEVELGVVIGESIHGRVTPEEAVAAVAGYVLANDLSDRWLQLERSGGQWSKGKSFPGSCALGPWIATADDIADPQDLALRSWVDEQPRQDSRTSDMIFSVASILVELATFMELEPGDLILTGTPQGVALSRRFPYLSEGDTVRLAIDGLGEIEQSVIPPLSKELS